MADYVQVFRDASGDWRWRRKARNHKVVATSGEGYQDKGYAVEQATERNPGLSVVVLGE